MSYDFELGRSLAWNLRDVAGSQIGNALKSLDRIGEDTEEAVHDLRKRMKKVRGLLRLLRSGLGKTYKVENAALRDVARHFSDVRDAQVLVESVGHLMSEDASAEERALLGPLEQWVKDRRAQVLEADLDVATEEARSELKAALDRVGDWDLGGDDEDILAEGIARTYGRAHAAQEDLGDGSGSPEAMHDWRKRIKYHRYHCRLVAPVWPEAILAQEALSDRIAELLGTDRDLFLLIEAADWANGAIPPDSIRLARKIAEARRDALRTEALALTPKLLAEPPDAIGKRFARYWVAANRA